MKRAYVHELKEQAAVCEHNFARLRRLLPDFRANEVVAFRLPADRGADTEMRLQVSERFRYTATVEVTLNQNHMPPAFARQDFRVRVYLDANTSEVVSRDQTGSFRGVYHYPNPQMYQTDEKAQLNRWLGEWLQVLFARGVTPLPLVFE